MTIIGLSGYAGSGKDEVGAFLVREHGFERVAFADVLKRVAYDLDPVIGHANAPGGFMHLADLVDKHGWDVAKTVPEVRRILQQLGSAVRRHLSFDAALEAAYSAMPRAFRVVFTDVRYPNEAEMIEACGGRIIRVEREGVGPANDHESERLLDDWPFSATICNDGTLDDLAKSVEDVMEKLGIV